MMKCFGITNKRAKEIIMNLGDLLNATHSEADFMKQVRYAKKKSEEAFFYGYVAGRFVERVKEEENVDKKNG